MSHGNPQKFVTAWTLPTKIPEITHPEGFTIKSLYCRTGAPVKIRGVTKNFNHLCNYQNMKTAKRPSYHHMELQLHLFTRESWAKILAGFTLSWHSALDMKKTCEAQPSYHHMELQLHLFTCESWAKILAGFTLSWHSALDWKRHVKHRLGALLSPLHPRQSPQAFVLRVLVGDPA